MVGDMSSCRPPQGREHTCVYKCSCDGRVLKPFALSGTHVYQPPPPPVATAVLLLYVDRGNDTFRCQQNLFLVFMADNCIFFLPRVLCAVYLYISWPRVSWKFCLFCACKWSC